MLTDYFDLFAVCMFTYINATPEDPFGSKMGEFFLDRFPEHSAVGGKVFLNNVGIVEGISYIFEKVPSSHNLMHNRPVHKFTVYGYDILFTHLPS